MKKIRFLVLLLLAALLTTLCTPMAAALDDPDVDCYAAVLMAIDDDSESVLYTKSAQDMVYPASLTKIMTVLLAVEAIEAGTAAPSDQVTAQPGFDSDQIEGGSTVYLGLGEVMSLENLLYCAMVASANEACNVIAQYIGGSVAGFVDMMNQRAAALGCANTHFANPHGLSAADHYTTAQDMALIAREAASHDLFMEICNTVTKTIPATNLAAERQLSSTNSLINPDNPLYPGDYLYEGAAGMKTGHTNDAGYCLVSTAERDGVRLLSVVMNAQATQLDGGTWYYGHFADTVTLFDWAFNNFSYQEIVKSTEIVADVPVSMGAGTDTVPARPSTSITALLPNDADLNTFTRTVTLESETAGKPLEAPVSAGQALGEITVSKDGVVYGSSVLVASTAVELSRSHYMKGQISETLKLPVVIISFWLLVALLVLYILLVVRYRAKRRAYQKRLDNARRIQLDLEDDEDEPRRRAPEPPVRPAPAPARPVRHPAHTYTERVAAPARTEEPEEPTRRPELPTIDEDDQEFRDYFEEYFGKNKPRQ